MTPATAADRMRLSPFQSLEGLCQRVRGFGATTSGSGFLSDRENVRDERRPLQASERADRDARTVCGIAAAQRRRG